MAASTLSILIIAVTLGLYLAPSIPVWVSTLLAALAMYGFGIIDFAEAFSGFGNSAALLIIGMMVMGQACFTTGLADRMSLVVGRYAHDQKLFVMVILVVGALLGLFLNGALVVPLLMAVVNVVIHNSGGAITRKATYLPISFGTVMGNNLTSVSASSMVLAASIIAEAGYKQLGVFELSAVTLPGVILCFVFYWFFGYDLSMKIWDFDEIPLDEPPAGLAQKNYVLWKQVFTVLVFVAVVGAILMGGNLGFCSLLGACALILSGCISVREAGEAVDWTTYIVAACALGMSAGLNASGGGQAVADFIFGIAGPLGQSPLGMCAVIFIVATILSNVMSDTATVAIVVPIALGMAQAAGWDALPLAIAAATGAKVAIATPICVTCHTMVATAGYRFMDYFTIGGILNLIQLVVTVFMLQIVYF